MLIKPIQHQLVVRRPVAKIRIFIATRKTATALESGKEKVETKKSRIYKNFFFVETFDVLTHARNISKNLFKEMLANRFNDDVMSCKTCCPDCKAA